MWHGICAFYLLYSNFGYLLSTFLSLFPGDSKSTSDIPLADALTQIFSLFTGIVACVLVFIIARGRIEFSRFLLFVLPLLWIRDLIVINLTSWGAIQSVISTLAYFLIGLFYKRLYDEYEVVD